MKSNDTRSQGRRHGRGGRRRPNYRDGQQRRASQPEAPRKISLWKRFLALFTGGGKPRSASPARVQAPRSQPERRPPGPPERVEVTSPKLYVGNLSYDATESDLLELFNGVGKVQNAEIVTHQATYRSKGFGFVTMLTLDEAVRAVETLHDKAFMGRKLVVSGSKSGDRRDSRD
jgi:RNA recognition motif. (a.k.a. RRM, RBD, or RNP domain)